MKLAVLRPGRGSMKAHTAAAGPWPITRVTFGDADLATIYVTDASGSLQRARTDRRGLART